MIESLLRSTCLVSSAHRTVLRFGIDDVVVVRISLRVETVASSGAEPISVGDPCIAAGLARTAPRTIILQAAIDVIRFTHVGSDGVKLRRRNGVDEFPGG